MFTVPYVIEQTNRGERSYDIYSRLLKDRKPGSYKISYSLKLQKLEDELQARLDEFNVEGRMRASNPMITTRANSSLRRAWTGRSST